MTARVAVLPFGGGDVLAHVGACVTVARELESRGHEVILAYGGLSRHALDADLRVEPVPEIDHTRLDAASLAGLLRGPEELAALVEADLKLLRRLKPAAAVVDSRLSAVIACELEGIPFVSVLHFFRATPWRTPEPRLQGLRRRARLRRAVRSVRRRFDRDPLGTMTINRIYSETRRSFGLSPDATYEGDRVACTTTPLLDPSDGLPQHWSYVGPVTWSAPGHGSPPSRGERPLVYVTQGSTGSAATLERAVRELADERVDVLVSTAALAEPEAIAALAPNVQAARLVDGRRCMEAADVAVVQGGHLTTLEAHLAATPVVVVPHGFDHFTWADRAERLGTGIAVRPLSLPGSIRRAVRRTLRRPRYRQAAANVAAELRRWDGPANVATLVEELVTSAGRSSLAEGRRSR